jgi:lysophospholipase L1-like esterase
MILFLGDSITDNWDTEKFEKDFSNFVTINLAKSGHTTKDTMNVINEKLDGLHPKLIVLLIGTNNHILSDDMTSEMIAIDIKNILDTLLIKYPRTKILLRGLLPREQNKDHKLRILNTQVNTIISKYENGVNIIYIDNGKEFFNENGLLTTELMPDYLHLSKKGYQILSSTLTPIIHQLMED